MNESRSDELLRMIDGYRVSQALYVAATLGIADLLADGPRASDELAAITETHAPSLYRLLRTLAAFGVLREDDDRRFALTRLGEPLRRDAPDSVYGWAAFIGRPYFWEVWGNLLQSVRTGETGYAHAFGTDGWSYRAAHPEESAIFDAAMTSMSRRSAEELVAAYDFSSFACIVDVGGGRGALLARVLQAAPGARGILFDQPHVVSGATATFEAAGIADRCEIVGGSFFEAVPAGGDAYLMRAVLHDWDDADCVRILRCVATVMPNDARLLVIDRLVPPPNEGAETKLSDLNMLVSPGGLERTREEFAALFEQAGLRLARVVPTAGTHSIIEAARAQDATRS